MSTLQVVKEKSTRLAKMEKGKEEEEEKVTGLNLVSFVAKT